MSVPPVVAAPDPSQRPAGQRRRGRLVRLLKLRVWVSEKFRLNDLQINLVFAAVVGLCAGMTSVGFRQLSRLLTGALTLHWPVSDLPFTQLGWEQRLLTPIIGGLAAGLFLWWGSRVSRSGTSTDYMEAIILGDGQLPFRYSLVKSVSALFTIASGGSIGREGPVVALCAVLASRFGRWTRLPKTRLRLLVACGAAAGMASVQNAPIGGALFVAEIVLGQTVMESLGPMVVASVVATQTVRSFIGDGPLYDVPPFSLNASWEMVPYALLGILFGLVAALYLGYLRASERVFAALRLPVYLRLALGGLVVGLLALFSSRVYGNGYEAINDLFHSPLLWRAALVLLVLKLLATAASFGSGAVGGVFTPTMFVGAYLGYLFGSGLGHFLPGAHFNPQAFALVGMGAFLAAATQAPLMSILMLVELTRDYQNVLPLMIGCVLAYYACGGAAGGRSIYSEALRRRAEREGRREPNWGESLVSDLMHPDPPAVPVSAGFQQIAENFITSRHVYLYVTDGAGHFEGAISLHDVKPYLNDPELAHLIIAGDIVREDFLYVHPRSTLKQAMAVFAKHDSERLPVVGDPELPPAPPADAGEAADDGIARANGAAHGGSHGLGNGSAVPAEPPKGRLLGSISKTDLILAITAAAQQAHPEAAGTTS